MELNEDIKCSICGLEVKSHKASYPYDVKSTEKLKIWQSDCARSLCEVLFKPEESLTFIQYFQTGNYCSRCLQIVRDVNFTWRQIKSFQNQMELLASNVYKLIQGNYIDIKQKSEEKSVEQRLDMLKDGFDIKKYSRYQIVEIMYSVVSKLGFIHPESAVTVKEEIEVEIDNPPACEDDYFISNGNEDAYSDNDNNSNPSMADLCDDNSSDSENDPSGSESEEENSISQGQVAEEENNLTKEDRRLQRRLNRELRKPSPELMKRKYKKVNYYDSDDLDYDPSTKKTKRNKKSDKEEVKPKLTDAMIVKKVITVPPGQKKRGRKSFGNISELVLDNNELTMFRNILPNDSLKNNVYQNLNANERKLVSKLTDLTMAAIRTLNVTDEEKLIIYHWRKNLKRRREAERVYYDCGEETCKKSFRIEEERDGHVRQHKGEELPFYCTTCPAKLPSYAFLLKHRNSLHGGFKLNFNFFCSICHKGFSAEVDFQNHSQEAHQGSNPFQCAFCPVQFTISSKLITHTNDSHMEVPVDVSPIFTCEKCGRIFAKKNILNKHLRRQHKQDKEKKCELCDKTLSCNYSYEKHMQQLHGNGKKDATPHICEVCGKVCAAKYSLQKHQEYVHTAERKYKCGVCGKGYRNTSALRNHERVHSGIREFVCRFCGKAFLTDTTLRGHEKIHEPGYIPRKPWRRPRPKKNKSIPSSSTTTASDIATATDYIEQHNMNMDYTINFADIIDMKVLTS